MADGPGEQPTNLLNILRFAVKNPRSVGVLARKIRKRADGHGRYSAEQNAAWLSSKSVSSENLARRLDPTLWEEAKAFGAEARLHARDIMSTVPFDMGAGGDYEFLYWLTRYRRPKVIVETGVSAGWTSLAFLSAIKRNAAGELHSSDFPYFRVKNPADYIGILVEPSLRAGWNLNIDGDEKALPRIVEAVPAIDIFHYDSDKSVSGRAFGFAQAKSKLAPNGLIFIDDINNDSWFREHVEESGEPFTVFGERYGMIGSLDGQAA